jgi:hypothetical protein
VIAKRYRVRTITFGRPGSSMPTGKGYFVYDMETRRNVPDPDRVDGLLRFKTREEAQAKVDELNDARPTRATHPLGL